MGYEFSSEDEIKGQFDILKKQQDLTRKGVSILKKYLEIDKAIKLLRNSKHRYVKIEVTGIDDESEDTTDVIVFELKEEDIQQHVITALVKEKQVLYKDYQQIR